ncbi:MAG: T9SS type A sorting domain-containing protein [Flavobacteriales bacterium]|nr:T9SS type A sorting domain-containing protein [Flavobacteriales bacterium]
MKKTLLSLIMLTSIGIYSSQAQITVNSGDVVNAGDVVEQASDTLPGAITIGGSGASQTWNFSALNEDVLDTLFFKVPGPLPGSSNFPLSNIGMVDTEEDSTWLFLTKNGAGLFVDGMYQIQQGQTTVFPLVSTIITFPSTMGTNYNGTWSGTLLGFDLSTLPLGLDSLKITRGTSASSNIDAWGNVTTPFGTFASLRQLVFQEDVDTTWEKSSATGLWTLISPSTISLLAGFGFNVTDISYDTTRTARWWTDDPIARFPLVEMDYEANGTVNSIDWQKSSPTVGVVEQAKAVNGVALYPNPAKNQITIETSLTNNNSIKILDVTGKLIADNSFKTNRITLSVSDFDNGIYFYTIYDVEGNVLYSNKFVVAK